MGKVYKARHVRMHRDVALKVIPPDCLENAGAVSRFYREVRAVSQLSHPNIVTAYEVGQEGKTHYFAMEFVEGIDLARLVKQSGPLPIAKACDYIRQAALGLQHAHEKGLVHRDIKPGNLIIGRSSAGGEPTVKVLDFGLARFEQAGGRGTRLTKLGNVLGTVDFISPEQAGNAREADIRSDIYSLGCALYYLLTGQPPFAGSDAMERMMARVMRPATSVREARPEVPVELEAIVAKMMAREPGERYATPAEVAAALGPFASSTTAVTARPGILAPITTTTTATNIPWLSLSTAAVAQPNRSHSRKKLALVAAIVVVVLAVAGLGLFNRGSSKRTKLPNVDPDVEPPIFVAQNGDPATKGLTKAKPPKDEPPPIVENSIGMRLAWIPAGNFQMGSPANEEGRDKSEGPVHEVEVTNPFYMGIHEVTQGQYTKVMGSNPSWFSSIGNAPHLVKGVNTREFPVESVSWYEALEFCRRLSDLPTEKDVQRIYDLPTEAEWEYACRAGTTTPFHFGNSSESSQANFNGEHPYGTAPKGNSLQRPNVVGMYRPNAWGLYDMHGNVCEWCKDWYSDQYCAAPRFVVHPKWESSTQWIVKVTLALAPCHASPGRTRC